MAGTFSPHPDIVQSTANSDQRKKDLWDSYQEWVTHRVLHFPSPSNSCACCSFSFKVCYKKLSCFLHLRMAAVTSRQVSLFSDPQDLWPAQNMSVCFCFKDWMALMANVLFTGSDFSMPFSCCYQASVCFFSSTEVKTLYKGSSIIIL